MSNSLFPLTIPGLDIQLKRTPIYKTKIQEAHSGKELRAAFWSTPRYRYEVMINFLRQNLNGNEVKTLLDFFELHKASWDSFLLNDPYDGVQRRVRFDMDELELERILADTALSGGQTWQAKTIRLISVK